MLPYIKPLHTIGKVSVNASIYKAITSVDKTSVDRTFSFTSETLSSGILFDSFIPLTESQVKQLVVNSSQGSCALDPMPTNLVGECLDVLLPVLTKIINSSLLSGTFPIDWKEALICPLLKKPNLDMKLENYRPISNLQFISKLTERAVCDQLYCYMSKHSMFPVFQSSYRKHHSTETALIKVKNDLLMRMNSQHVILLILLDLSAAFDTVDHVILLKRLQSKFGVTGKALDWFSSYLSDRSQRVSIQGTLSEKLNINCSVPQGSCLGPFLFIVYASELFDIIEHHLPDVHCYADDIQLYLSFRPDDISCQAAVTIMENCIRDIRQWMLHDRLLINDAKSEFLIIGSKQQLKKINISNIMIGDAKVFPTTCVRNLGSWFDSELTMNTHINKACSAAFFHLHNIKRISQFLTQDSLLKLIHAFVTSRLDYCNSLLYGLPKSQIAKLQRVQNAAARIVTNTHRFEHITPIIRQLHWLPVSYRINFKILLLTFKVLHGLSPKYLQDLVSIRKVSSYQLRSGNNGIFLDYPSGKMLTTFGDRAFSVAAPKLWNALPFHIRSEQKLTSFKCNIKTHLFKAAF